MKKKEIVSGIFALLFITIASGYLLAQVYKITSPKIEEQKRIEAERLNKEIFFDGVKFAEKEENGIMFTVAYDCNEKEIGKIFEIKSLGYGGFITIKVGLDTELKVKGVKILEHRETPGLGTKITKDSFLEQFKNLGAKNLYLKKDNPAGKIDSITGATISSRAVADGVRKTIEKLKVKNFKRTIGYRLPARPTIGGQARFGRRIG